MGQWSSWFCLFVLLVSFQTLLSMQSGCSYRYTSEPGSSLEACNIVGTSANITCHMERTGPYFEIQWYYTADPSLAGVLNTTTQLDITGNNDYTIESSVSFYNDFTIRKYHFLISKVDETTTGYYWCGVLGQPSPSQVVHINQQCNISTVHTCSNSHVLLSHSSTNTRCADTASHNVTIVAAQDLVCHVTTPLPSPTTQSKTVTTTTQQTTKNTPAIITTTKEDKPAIPSTTTTEDKKPTEMVTEEEKLTTPSTTQSELIPTRQEISTFFPTATTGDVAVNVSPQSGGGLPTDVIWLSIGIILTLLLVGVFVLLTVIATLQWKKRKIKGVSSSTTEVQGYADPRDTVIPLENIGSQLKKGESDLDPVYAEIPGSAVPANLLRLGVPNPFYTAGDSSSSVPLSPGSSGQYEDLSLHPCPASREQTTAIDGPGSGRSSQKRPSTSSTPHSPLPVINDVVFDDPKYDVIESPPVQRKHSKVQVTLSVPHEDSRSETEDYKQSVSEFNTKSKLGRKFSLEPDSSHGYTPVIPASCKEDSNYTFAIVNTDEKYVSEQGHLYHVLESSTQSEREGSTSPGKPVSPVSNQSHEVPDEHVYSVLEDSSNSRE